MSPVHKEVSHDCVSHECSVVHTVVHQDEDWWEFLLSYSGCNFPLSFHYFLDCFSVVISIDEEVGYKLLVVSISIFGTGHCDSCWDVLLVPENVRHQSRLPRASLPNENTHLVVSHLRGIEPLEIKTHSYNSLSNYEL